MKSTILILIFAIAAIAGVFSFNWGPVDCDFSALEIQSKGAVVKTIDPVDGVFPECAEVIESYFVVPEGCIGCGICVNQCPVDAITLNEENIAFIDPEICIVCGICASACPTSTIELLDEDECALYGVDAEGNSVLLQEVFEVE